MPNAHCFWKQQKQFKILQSKIIIIHTYYSFWNQTLLFTKKCKSLYEPKQFCISYFFCRFHHMKKETAKNSVQMIFAAQLSQNNKWISSQKLKILISVCARGFLQYKQFQPLAPTKLTMFLPKENIYLLKPKLFVSFLLRFLFFLFLFLFELLNRTLFSSCGSPGGREGTPLNITSNVQ